ncbi:MAG: AAA family ATPase, partial [Desulfobacterales bacterium]|nr:AAA family ATPase [Desulfobacterales bacterium]
RNNTEALKALFGADTGRYPAAAERCVKLRAPEMKGGDDSGVPFAAYIHPNNPDSGPYAGMSFVIFPVPEGPCLVLMVIGTQGLSPDETILGRPGHARRLQAICGWLNAQYGAQAWAKQDPTRTDIRMPVRAEGYRKVFDRYGGEIYAMFRPTDDKQATYRAVAAFLDVMFAERGYQPVAKWKKEASTFRTEWMDSLMPSVTAAQVAALLRTRRYVILQGPPGTGKTRMAGELLRDHYGSHGRAVQFHPNTTYENFIGGLAPEQGDSTLGLRFAPKPGYLMEAVADAGDKPYLLHIDEINRADLSKVLGEAIFLLEADDANREITLPYTFGDSRTLKLPPNLHILGTMNTADRSIAIVDVAVRRRFAFVSLWPGVAVVQQHGSALTLAKYEELLDLFVEHASDDAMALLPGHSYFLTNGCEDDGRSKLKTALAPLLREYLAQGYVAGFAEEVRAYVSGIEAL